MKHFYTKIQGWGITKYGKLYKEQVESAKDGSHFVEVGAWKGKSTAFMGVEIHNSGKKIAFHTVDTWFGSDESFHKKDPAIIENRLYEVFLENIEPVSHIVNPIRMTSLAASDEFMDHSLDFVFLDASHEYKDVKDDIEHWLPKVKIGGTLGGDDMNWKGVRRAVEDTLTNFEDHGRYWTYKIETF